ncbi:hypothetical protein BCR39DRAFT_467093 [Naematelia encephala]|uniref:F-box domain-containing protein n=1 Tax=Naematelia encephala TaxID=71784 RepID=A0A1Y2B4M5_9TREE|nr:hypothetical protein BCR39DRAFT_467093 [Naematelia encephala]
MNNASSLPVEHASGPSEITTPPQPPSSPLQPPVPFLFRLPPELIDQLLDHVPPHLLQRTALSLIRVFPDYPLSSRHLWTHLTVHRASQLIPLWHKLRSEGKKPGRGNVAFARTLCQESWRGDADILNNVLRCLPDLTVLMLNIGTNFAPEHLEEMFEDPRLGIQRMEMRFRPYVEQATYYQFLKGSYFDTAIETLYRRWPEVPSFTHLSIIQDLPPRSTLPPTAFNSTTATAANSASNSLANSIADISLDPSDSDQTSGRSTPPTSVASESPVEGKGYTGHGPFPYISENMKGYTKPKHFAQPIVFFDIKCIARFGLSPVARHLTHLRLRVPSRDLAYVLIGPQGNHAPIFPSLRYLDISTTNVRLDSVFSTLLRSYTRLEHLVLDHVNLFGFTAKEKGPELCKDLGGIIVSAALSRGKERERQVLVWEVAQRTRRAEAEAERRRQMEPADRSDGGGESDDQDDEALVAIRQAEAAEAERQRQIELSRSRRGHRSAAHSTFSLRDRPARASASTRIATPSIPLPPPDTLYLVLPPLPTLQSISIGGEAHHLSPAKVAEWEHEFHSGWREGLGKVLGWAGHVADKYERAIRKASEWRAQEIKRSGGGKSTGQSESSASSSRPAKAKGKQTTTSTHNTNTTQTKPPTDIRLFRFPSSGETTPFPNPTNNPLEDLIEVHPSGRDYLEPYKLAIAEADMWENNHSVKSMCVFCTVPDCEGPARRGADGERVDGRGGLGGKHRDDCGHLLGRQIWGWQGV